MAESEALASLDSRSLRDKLLGILEKSELTSRARFFVFYFCCLNNKKWRIVQGMEGMTNELSKTKDFKDALSFIKTNMVKLPGEETVDTFATIYTPHTNPGFACCLIMWNLNDKTVEKFLYMQVATQINLNCELMARNKEKSLFGESIFSNLAKYMTYNLVTMSREEVPPEGASVGYTEAEFEWRGRELGLI